MRLYGRYGTAGDATIIIKGVIDGQRFSQTSRLSFPETDLANPEIERMWAWHRIQALMDRGRKLGFSQGTIDEIVQLGEAHSIVSEYTSFLVLENDAEYKRWKIERRNALQILNDRAAQQALRERIDELRNEALAQIGPVQDLQIAQAKPNPSHNSVSQQQAAQRTAPSQPATRSQDAPHESNRSSSFPLPSRSRSGGSGAFDPFSAVGALLLGAGFIGYSRRRNSR